jgi:hypothetical protein
MAGILIGVDVAEDGTSTTVYGERYSDGTFRITHMSKTPATPAKGIVHKWKPLSLEPRFQFGDVVRLKDQVVLSEEAGRGRWMIISDKATRVSTSAGSKLPAICIVPPSGSWTAGEVDSVWIDQMVRAE